MENNSAPCKLIIPNNLRPKTPAFFVNFSNGSINNSRKLSFKSLRHADDKYAASSAARRVLLANNNRLNYQSNVVSNSNCDQNKMRYYIGVRNKRSGEMNVYDALTFHLKPILKTDILASPSTFEARNVREKLNDLTASFGSKEMKRTMNARQKYSTDTAPLEQTLNMSIDESLPNTDLSISMPNSHSSIEYMPPQNRNAKSVDEVYRINDIIPAEQDQFLTELADKLLEDLPTCLFQWISDNAYCEYVLNHLNTALDDVKVKYLIYYDFLIVFSKLTAADLKKRDPAPEIPEPIKSSLLDFFTASSENESGKIIRNFSKLMKDKLLAYVLVLALFIDNYCVNLAVVQSGTKCSMSKIVSVAQALGCHITRQKVNNLTIPIAELRLPLFVQKKYYKKF